MFDEDDINLLLDTLNLHFSSLYSLIKNAEEALTIGFTNEKLEGLDVTGAVKKVIDEQRDRMQKIDRIKVKLYELKSKMLDGKSNLTFNDLMN